MRKIWLSVIIPAKNEAGTIDAIIRSLPEFGKRTELVFVDGNSTDGTWELVKSWQKKRQGIRLLRQRGSGKWDAVAQGMASARGETLIIYDADMSVPIADLKKFYRTALSNPNALIIGSRFVYRQEKGAMRLLNHTGNIFFSRVFSWICGSKITDTLCGTKVVSRVRYADILNVTQTFRHHDPYGDFTLLLGAAMRRMPILEVPVRYKARVYGETKIHRFRDGIKLLIVLLHALVTWWGRSYATISR